MPSSAPSAGRKCSYQKWGRACCGLPRACGWQPEQVEGLLIGMSGPAADDYLARSAACARLRPDVLKVSLHKACDGSMGALHLALNPRLAPAGVTNVAEELRGKKELFHCPHTKLV